MSVARITSVFFLAVIGVSGQGSRLAISTPSALVPGAIGVTYSQTFTATGGTPPYTWSVPSGALPPGLTLSSSGAITGTPEAAGTYQFSIMVMDSASATSVQTFAITVISRGTLLRFGALSQFAAGGLGDTTITLINTSSAVIAITVVFRADDGSELSLPLTLTQQGSSQTITGSSINALLNPNSTVLVGTGALANTVIGWADVLSSGPISGFGIIRSTPTNDKPSEATVPLQTSLGSSFLLPYDNMAGYAMGVALVNLASGPAVVNAAIFDDNGTQLGTQQISIPGNGHTAFVLADKMPVTTATRGVIQFRSTSGGISGLGLRFSPAGPFTDVPVVVQ